MPYLQVLARELDMKLPRGQAVMCYARAVCLDVRLEKRICPAGKARNLSWKRGERLLAICYLAPLRHGMGKGRMYVGEWGAIVLVDER